MSEPLDTCFLCRWLDLDTGSPHYSDYTPGASFSMECIKGRFPAFQVGDHSPGRWATTIVQSRTCPDAEARQKTEETVCPHCGLRTEL